MPDVTSDPKTTFDLFVTIFTFGSTIAGAAFWVASWRSQMLLKELQLELQAQHLTFREEIQKAIDKNNENFQMDIRRSVNINIDKIKVLRTRIKKIELFLNNLDNTLKKSIPINSSTTDLDSEN